MIDHQSKYINARYQFDDQIYEILLTLHVLILGHSSTKRTDVSNI